MFFALAHMVGAMQDHVSCTCTHGWCYARSCFLHLLTWSVLRNTMGWGGVGMIIVFALARMVGATQYHVPCTCTHGRCYARSCFSCTCTHGRCYALSCFLHLHTWLVLRPYAISCFLHLHIWSVLRKIMF